MKNNMTAEQEALAEAAYYGFHVSEPVYPLWVTLPESTKLRWYSAAEAAITNWLKAELNKDKYKQIP